MALTTVEIDLLSKLVNYVVLLINRQVGGSSTECMESTACLFAALDAIQAEE
jgi:hypothetical protein